MSVPRILLPGTDGTVSDITITGAPLRHLRARRLGPGDRFVVFDGHGREWDAVLTELGRRAAAARVTPRPVAGRESPLTLELAVALLRGPRMDLVLEKGTELGVTRFRPIVTARVQRGREQTARWRRVAAAAAEQCGRTVLPAVDPPRPLAAVLENPDDAVVVLAFEGERRRGIETTPARAGRVLAVTGPEGGFTPEEVEAARRAGAYIVGLGPRLLRAETAALVLAALAQHRWGDA